MKKLSALLFSIIFCSNCYSQIDFVTLGGRPTVRITDPVSGDDLRTFINANAATGTVTNNDIEFFADLRIQGAGELTDNNAVYHLSLIHI